MEKQEVFYIHGYPIIVNITFRNRATKRVTYSGGIINVTLTPSYNKKKVEETLERLFPISKIKKFNSEFYVGNDYIYITGKKHRLVILEENQERENMDDYVFKRRKDIKNDLRKIARDVYTNEVRKLEKEMGINKPHLVKVTRMTSALGKHYHQKHLITLEESLIHYSIEIIDSVVAHELCHYFYQNHSKSFYDLLLKYCPNYKELRKKLTYGVKK